MQADPIPDFLSHLPVDPVRKLIVPWFVAWIDGKPEFRMAQGGKVATAVNQHRCWVCGKRHEPGRVTYVAGPMCGINRVSAEPPSHLACARYSAKNCPFLSKPHMVRRDREAVAAQGSCAGVMIDRNPGVTLLWTCAEVRTFGDGRGGVLFRLAEPLALEFWSQGRAATRAEVLASIESGLPLLAGPAAEESPPAMLELSRMKDDFLALLDRYLPAKEAS